MQAIAGVVSGLSSSISRPMGTYQHRTISIWVHLDVLDDVPFWHPRAHDEKWKPPLRNLDDGEHVWMRIDLAFFDHTAIFLVSSELSTPPIE